MCDKGTSEAALPSRRWKKVKLNLASLLVAHQSVQPDHSCTFQFNRDAPALVPSVACDSVSDSVVGSGQSDVDAFFLL